MSDTLVDKIVKFNSYLSPLPIRGKVAYVNEWQSGEPASYLICPPGFGSRWGKPQEVKVDDIVEILEN